MDIKKAKELSADVIYEITQMASLIDNQTEEIEYLKDKLEECKIEDLTELYPSNCSTENEDVPFDDEHDFYEE